MARRAMTQAFPGWHPDCNTYVSKSIVGLAQHRKGLHMNRPLTGALAALAIAIGGTTALPTQAQDAPNTAQMNERADDDRDFGWIGLFGLIGLAGLMGRKRDQHYDTTHRTTAAR